MTIEEEFGFTRISLPWTASGYLDKEAGTEAAVWGSDGDAVALVHGNLALETEALPTAQFIALAGNYHDRLVEVVKGLTADKPIQSAQLYAAHQLLTNIQSDLAELERGQGHET